MNSESDIALSSEHREPSWRTWPLRHPLWSMLLLLSALVMAAVIASVVIEKRRAEARRFIENDSRFTTGIGVTRPIALLGWLPAYQVPDPLCVDDVDVLFVKGPLTADEVALINRLNSIAEVFLDDALLSEADVLEFLNQPLRELWPPRQLKLSNAALRTIAAHPTLENFGYVLGPFDQSRLDVLGTFDSRTVFHLDGRCEPEAIPAFTPRSSMWWKNSDLSDEAFASLMAKPSFSNLGIFKSRLTSKSWPLLAKLTCTSLRIQSPNIDPSIAENVPDCVEDLELSGGSLSDESVHTLIGETRRTLCLSARNLTIEAAKHLGESNLSEITLLDAETVDDQWAKELGKRPFDSVKIVNSRITDDGVRSFTSVRCLELPGSRLSDQCISSLSNLRDLRRLDLRMTAISDRGLRSLMVKTDVFLQIHLGGTKVTSAGAKDLVKTYPRTEIYGVPGIPEPKHATRWMDLSPTPMNPGGDN